MEKPKLMTAEQAQAAEVEEDRLHAVARLLYVDMLRANLSLLGRSALPPSPQKTQEVVRMTVDASISAAFCFQTRFNGRHAMDIDTDAMSFGLDGETKQ